MNQLLRNWNLMRIIRFVLGITIVVEGVRNQMIPLAVAGAAFSALALFNIGCCGVSGCPLTSQNTKQSEKIEYEEVQK